MVHRVVTIPRMVTNSTDQTQAPELNYVGKKIVSQKILSQNFVWFCEVKSHRPLRPLFLLEFVWQGEKSDNHDTQPRLRLGSVVVVLGI